MEAVRWVAGRTAADYAPGLLDYMLLTDSHLKR